MAEIQLCYTVDSLPGSPALATIDSPLDVCLCSSCRQRTVLMKSIKTVGLASLMFALLLGPQPAVAQAPYQPYLNVTAVGFRVTIEWTPIAGAWGYNIQVGTAPGAANIGSINIPNMNPRIVVDAPPGVYFLRIRAFAGAIYGPFSNEAVIAVGGSCELPPAPAVSSVVSGSNVTISWGAVPNVLGYRVEAGRSPGAVELVQNLLPNVTSVTQSVPVSGTFYARVLAGNACGISTGNEVAFTIGGGSGPRTPDPPPGGRLPMPGYGPAVAQAVAAAFPGDLQRSCVEAGGNNIWLFRLVHALRQHDSRWGLNWKRQVFGDMSQDIVTYNYGAGPDEDSRNVYGIDVIVGHCGPRPGWNWHDVTNPNGAGARWTLLPYLAAGFPP